MTRTNLDLMRALAVSLVLFDHSATAFGHQYAAGLDLGWLGVFGVYLFFVHTCLVLMWSLERRPHTLDFYVRRVFRIYPLAIVVVLLALALHVPDFAVSRLTPKVLLFNLLLVNELFGAPLVQFVFWSLLVELQMYLVLPPLFLFARRERTFWPFLVFWGFACKFSLATYGRAQPVYPLISNIPFFFPGIIAYLGFKRHVPRLSAFGLSALLVLLGLCFAMKPSVELGWLMAMSVALLLPLFRDVQNRRITTVTHTIAKYSYGIYLLHPLVLRVVVSRLAAYSITVRVTVELVLVAGLSVLAYHAVEHPLMQVGSRVANRLQGRFGSNSAADYGLDLA